MISTTFNRDLMQQARENLRGKWHAAAGVYLLYVVMIILTQVIPVAGILIQILVTGPLMLGLARYFLNLARNEPVEVGQLFSGFNDFGRALLAYALTFTYILLWSLLLVIPGIMAMLSYAMTYFVLLDHPEMGANAAIGESRRLMYGNRWKLFCLGCRFIGWALLTILTFGIGMLWVYPYMQVSFARFYEDIKEAPEALPPA